MILPVLRRLSFVLVILAFALPLATQEQWSWPEQPKNLKVLPKDTGGRKLATVMTGFTRALGVRCTHCHVGEEGKPLSTYDFVSDANPKKEAAREMLRMVSGIAEHVQKVAPAGGRRVDAWCNTCHRGRPRPTTLADELRTAYEKGGGAAAVARYRELREKYLTSGTIDFRERELNELGYELLGKKDYDGAIAILRLNAEQFPQSGNVWDSLAEAYLGAGNKLQAEIYYRKSLELDPKNEEAVKKLKELAKP